MKVMILGATSVIGRRLIKELCKHKGNTIYAVVRSIRKADLDLFVSNNVTLICSSMAEYHFLLNEKIGTFDWIIAFSWKGLDIAQRNDYEIQKFNYDVLNSFYCSALEKETTQNIITIGTQMEYGLYIQRGDFMEESTCKPCTAYGEMKLRLFESVNIKAKAVKARHYHLRLFGVYSEEASDDKIINLVAKELAKERIFKLKTNCNQYWNLLYVDDCINAILQVLSGEIEEGIYNIGSGDGRKLCDYLETMDLIATGGKCLYFGEDISDDGMPVCDIKKILSTGKWVPSTTWEMGAVKLVRHCVY